MTEGKGVIGQKGLIGLRELKEKGPKELIEMTESKDPGETEMMAGEIMRIEEIVRIEGIVMREGIERIGESSLPGDRILLTEEMTIGVSEEKETNKEMTGDQGDTEMIETNEEYTRTVIMEIFRRTGGKEKYPRTDIPKRLAKKQRRTEPPS